MCHLMLTSIAYIAPNSKMLGPQNTFETNTFRNSQNIEPAKIQTGNVGNLAIFRRDENYSINKALEFLTRA
ncbi:unnamed protein product [Ixodes persulcatus]